MIVRSERFSTCCDRSVQAENLPWPVRFRYGSKNSEEDEISAGRICQMIRLLTFTLFFVILGCVAGQAQDNIDHGPTGTLNHDYFSSRTDALFLGYRDSINTAHANPGFSAFARGDMRETKVQLEYVLQRTINHPQMLALAAVFSI